MLDTRPFLASYFLFPADEGGSPWPIEDGDPPTLHLLGDGSWGDEQERLVRLIAAKDTSVGASLEYVGSVVATYDVQEVTYPGGIGSRRIIKRNSGGDLSAVFGSEFWFNIDGDGWIHDENITGPDRDSWTVTDFGGSGQPTSYQVQFHVRTEETVPIGGTWAEVLGMTLSDVELPVEKHYDDGTVESDGVIPGRRCVLAGSNWTHADSRVTPIDRQGLQNLLTSFGEDPPNPWGGPFPTDPEDPCYDPDPPMPHWPTAFGSPARYYGPTGSTAWKLVVHARLQPNQFTAGIGILETNGMAMDNFMASLNAGVLDDITGCPVQVDDGDPIFNDTPSYAALRIAVNLYQEVSPWGGTGAFNPVECAAQAFPVSGVAVEGGYAADVGDLTLTFHALAADDGGFHDFRETTGIGTALATVTTYLEGGDKLIYSGPLGELPRPFSGHASVFCGKSITADEPYSLDVLELDAGVRVVMIQAGQVTVWDYATEATVLWSDSLANSLPPDLYDVMDVSDPVLGYRFVMPAWPHRTGVVTVGGVNVLIEAADRLRDVRYRVPGGRPPVAFAFGWSEP